MRKLKILVKTKKSTKTGHEYQAYSTIEADGSYIDVKFNSKGVDTSKLPTKTFIIYVNEEDLNERNKERDGAPIYSEKKEGYVRELWVSKIEKFADEKEVEEDNAAYRKARSAKIAAEYIEA